MTSIVHQHQHQHLPIVSNDDFQQQLPSLKRNYKDNDKLKSGNISQPPETKLDDPDDSSAVPLQKKPKITPMGQSHEGVLNRPAELPHEVSSENKDSVVNEDRPVIASEGQNSEGLSNFPTGLPQEDRAKLASEGQNLEGVVILPVELPQVVSSNKESSTRRSKNGGRKAVEKLCLKTGEVMGTFRSVTEAAKSVDVSVAAIRHALTGLKGRKSSAGFGWRYAPPGAVPDSPISADQLKVELLCLETGKVLRLFDSLKEASKLTGLTRKHVRMAIGNVYEGFFWRAGGSADLSQHPPPALMPLPTNQITTDANRPRKPASTRSQLNTTSASLESPPNTQTPIETFSKPVQTSSNSRHWKNPEPSTDLPKATSQKAVDQESLTSESICLRRAESTNDREVLPRTMNHNLPLSMPLSTDHTTIDTRHPEMPVSTGLKLNTTTVSSKSSANPQTPIDTDKSVRTSANSRYLETLEPTKVLPSATSEKSVQASMAECRKQSTVVKRGSLGIQGILPSQSEEKSIKAYAVDGRDTPQVAPEYFPGRFQVGDVVFCNHQAGGNKAEGQWQKGRVATVHKKAGRCDVVFEDGKVSCCPIYLQLNIAFHLCR
jgi:hypothetical protein